MDIAENASKVSIAQRKGAPMARLLYILLLAASALFYPLYTDKLSFITLCAMLILPVIMLIQLAISAAFIRMKPVKDSVTAFKGSEGEIAVRLYNNSVFPLSNVKIRAKVICRPTGSTHTLTAAVPLPALSSQTVTFNVSLPFCGGAEIYLESVQIYDLLRLFSLKLFKNAGHCGTVYVIPPLTDRYADYAAHLTERLQGEQTEDDVSARTDSGSFGDVSGYRDFMPGDRLSRIHHKLSARFDSDIVKVMSPGESGSFLLWADLSAGDGSEEQLMRRDMLLEKLLSVACLLNAGGAEVCAAVPDDAENADIFPIGGGLAAGYSGDNDYFAIARILACADFSGENFSACAGNNGDYFPVHIDGNDL